MGGTRPAPVGAGYWTAQVGQWGSSLRRAHAGRAARLQQDMAVRERCQQQPFHERVLAYQHLTHLGTHGVVARLDRADVRRTLREVVPAS